MSQNLAIAATLARAMLDPVKVNHHINNLLRSRTQWQNITLGLLIFILVFVTFFYHTYQNINDRLRKINKEQKIQRELLTKLTKEKNQIEKKSKLRYRIWT